VICHSITTVLQPLYAKRIQSFGRFFDIKLNFVFVLKRPPGLLVRDVRVMYEYIFGPVVGGDEAKSFFDAEPFHCSLWHIGVGVGDCVTPLCKCTGCTLHTALLRT